LNRSDNIAKSVKDNGAATTNRQHLTTNDNIRFDKGHRDNTLFHLANHLVKGEMPVATIEQYLTFIARHCNPPFLQKEIQARIQSALKRAESRERNLTQELRDLIVTTSGNISTTFVYNCQHLTTREEKKTALVILGRFVKEGLLERVPGQVGMYRRVESEVETIDFLNATSEVFPVKWPFQVEQLVEVMPGNLVCVAGEIEAGKTAFLLNVAKLNMNHFDVHYFSSEMGASEFKKRLSKFEGMNLNDWKDLKAKARAGDFQDVIRPDALNIIDFIEVHDEFYKVGAYLKRIHDKLKSGIAIVAIQKNPGRDEGLGGNRSMEVARLYLSMSKEFPGGRLKITKGKNWATDKNPNGLSIKYNIIGGCKFKRDGDWTRT